jgi:anhydro-N-acetylmuramic acid kinase
MNPQIKRLYEVAQKPERLIIGLMSGTSLDGLDIALCRFTGSGKNTTAELLKFETVAYEDTFKNAVREVFAKDQISLPHLCRLNPWIGSQHGKMINHTLKGWGIKNSEINAIASHGQTVMHSPVRLHGLTEYSNATLQIGDGDHLAVETGILTISDFRQKHCALGGEGAPLALYGDYLLFGSAQENRVLINIGGIANFTFLPANQDFQAVFATDTGPGNTIIDAFVQKNYAVPFDKNAAYGKKGKLHQSLLESLLNEPYFGQDIPKTTGPELFNLAYLNRAIGSLNITKEDILHTLYYFTAETLCAEIMRSVNAEYLRNTSVYLSGGGMHNPLLCDLIKKRLPKLSVKKMDDLGISGDAKEAVLFAALANETLAGETGFVSPKSSNRLFFMGKVSFSA